MEFTEMPAVWGNYLSIAGFVVLLVLVWMVPKKLIYTDAPDQATWRDVRLWATALIAIQITVYIVFS